MFIHVSLFFLGWMVIFHALVGCHDILILGKSLVKWRQRPNMTLAVDWDVQHQFNQTNIIERTVYICLNCLLTVRRQLVFNSVDVINVLGT